MYTFFKIFGIALTIFMLLAFAGLILGGIAFVEYKMYQDLIRGISQMNNIIYKIGFAFFTGMVMLAVASLPIWPFFLTWLNRDVNGCPWGREK